MTTLGYQLIGGASESVTMYLHGFLGSGEDWRDTVSFIEEDSARTQSNHLLIDLPGHGKSVGLPDDCYTMSGGAKLTIDLLDRLRIERCSIVGYSMGGRLALYLAMNHPERFDRFVLESTSPGLRTKTEREERVVHDGQLAQRLGSMELREFISEWYDQPLFASIDKRCESFGDMVTRRLKENPHELSRSLRSMGTGVQPSSWGQLDSIEAPMLFLAGEKDRKFSSLAEQMGDLCPGGRTAIIPGAGHNVHFERPVEFAEKVTRFLHEDKRGGDE